MPSSLTKVLPLILGFSPFLPVSVCGTGIFSLDSGFSWQCELVFFSTCFSIPIIPYFSEDTDLPISSGLVFGRTLPCRAVKLILLRPHFSMATIDSTGISTSCPSTTLFSLILGPDLPWGDEPCPGILRFSMGKILTYLSLLMPAFSLLFSPQLLSVLLLPKYNAPLPLAFASPRLRC